MDTNFIGPFEISRFVSLVYFGPTFTRADFHHKSPRNSSRYVLVGSIDFARFASLESN